MSWPSSISNFEVTQVASWSKRIDFHKTKLQILVPLIDILLYLSDNHARLVSPTDILLFTLSFRPISLFILLAIFSDELEGWIINQLNPLLSDKTNHLDHVYDDKTLLANPTRWPIKANEPSTLSHHCMRLSTRNCKIRCRTILIILFQLRGT